MSKISATQIYNQLQDNVIKQKQETQKLIQQIQQQATYTQNIDNLCNQKYEELNRCNELVKQLDDLVSQQQTQQTQIMSQTLFQQSKNFLLIYKNIFQDLQKQLQQAVDQKAQQSQQITATNKQQITVASSTYNMFAENMKQSEEQFTQQALIHVKNIKQSMRLIGENIEEGKLEGDQLQKDIQENKEKQIATNTVVNKASKYMKRNKDCLFLGITLIDTVVLILVFILV